MARKKIVYVIVEGPSDDEALGVILSRLYDKNIVQVEITHGDITSNPKINSSQILSKVGDIVRYYGMNNGFKQKNFQEVIHIMDTDGTYIDDDRIVKNDEAINKPIYSLTEIKTANPEGLRERNKNKKENMDKLCGSQHVWVSIPYRAFYMSSNLDHVLYNKLNSSDSDKEKDALSIAKKYKDDLDGFLTFISDSSFSVMGGYKESWDFIRQDLHSLERYTNLGICFNELREQRKELIGG